MTLFKNGKKSTFKVFWELDKSRYSCKGSEKAWPYNNNIYISLFIVITTTKLTLKVLLFDIWLFLLDCSDCFHAYCQFINNKLASEVYNNYYTQELAIRSLTVTNWTTFFLSLKPTTFVFCMRRDSITTRLYIIIIGYEDTAYCNREKNERIRDNGTQ